MESIVFASQLIQDGGADKAVVGGALVIPPGPGQRFDYCRPIVEEVRARRMEISAHFDHDLEKYLAHLREVEQECQNRVVNQVTVIRPPRAVEPVK